jgi:hypothetical protein
VPGAFGAAIGNGPFTRTITGLEAFRELCVADADANLNDFGTGVDLSSDLVQPIAWPNPANDTVLLRVAPGTNIKAINVIDAQGRRSAIPAERGGDLVRIGLDGFAPGVYLLESMDDHDRVHPYRIVIAR